MNSRNWSSGSTPSKPGTSRPPITANTVGTACTCSACTTRTSVSASTLPSTSAPLPSLATASSVSTIGAAVAARAEVTTSSTGTWNERSSISVWKFASVTCDDVRPGGRRRSLGRARGGLGAGLDRGEVDRPGHRGGQRRIGRRRALLTAAAGHRGETAGSDRGIPRAVRHGLARSTSSSPRISPAARNPSPN